jgi:hypothetical protein
MDDPNLNLGQDTRANRTSTPIDQPALARYLRDRITRRVTCDSDTRWLVMLSVSPGIFFFPWYNY